MPVANDVAWVLVARRYAVSSRPTADTGPAPAPGPAAGLSRAGASIDGVPRSRTWSITVHHATPSLAATAATAASCSPTCSKAHCRARSVSTARGAIASCCSVHVLVSHAACGQHHTRFHQHSTTARPPIGRSRTHVGRRSFARPTAPQRGQPTSSAVVSTSSSSSPPTSAAVRSRNPASPTKAAVIDVISSCPTWVSFTVVATWS